MTSARSGRQDRQSSKIDAPASPAPSGRDRLTSATRNPEPAARDPHKTPRGSPGARSFWASPPAGVLCCWGWDHLWPEGCGRGRPRRCNARPSRFKLTEIYTTLDQPAAPTLIHHHHHHHHLRCKIIPPHLQCRAYTCTHNTSYACTPLKHPLVSPHHAAHYLCTLILDCCNQCLIMAFDSWLSYRTKSCLPPVDRVHLPAHLYSIGHCFDRPRLWPGVGNNPMWHGCPLLVGQFPKYTRPLTIQPVV